jgi:hypothetical protein
MCVAAQRRGGMKIIREMVLFVLLAAVVSAMAVEVLHAFGVYYR